MNPARPKSTINWRTLRGIQYQNSITLIQDRQGPCRKVLEYP
jgi:hypothetical protein